MRRIIFLNKYFFPDHSATSQILGDLAFALGADGTEIHVVTSRQRYDDPQSDLTAEENAAGVAIHRIATTRFGRGSVFGRAIDYLSFYRAVRRAVLEIAEPGDIPVAKTDPPL